MLKFRCFLLLSLVVFLFFVWAGCQELHATSATAEQEDNEILMGEQLERVEYPPSSVLFAGNYHWAQEGRYPNAFTVPGSDVKQRNQIYRSGGMRISYRGVGRYHVMADVVQIEASGNSLGGMCEFEAEFIREKTVLRYVEDAPWERVYTEKGGVFVIESIGVGRITMYSVLPAFSGKESLFSVVCGRNVTLEGQEFTKGVTPDALPWRGDAAEEAKYSSLEAP